MLLLLRAAIRLGIEHSTGPSGLLRRHKRWRRARNGGLPVASGTRPGQAPAASGQSAARTGACCNVPFTVPARHRNTPAQGTPPTLYRGLSANAGMADSQAAGPHTRRRRGVLRPPASSTREQAPQAILRCAPPQGTGLGPASRLQGCPRQLDGPRPRMDKTAGPDRQPGRSPPSSAGRSGVPQGQPWTRSCPQEGCRSRICHKRRGEGAPGGLRPAMAPAAERLVRGRRHRRRPPRFQICGTAPVQASPDARASGFPPPAVCRAAKARQSMARMAIKQRPALSRGRPVTGSSTPRPGRPRCRNCTAAPHRS